MTTSRAAVVTELNGPTEIWDVPIPALAPGSVLIKVDAATLCGTDVARWTGDSAVERPFLPGHETTGRIVDMNGTPVDILGSPLKIGDRIVSSYPSCGHCYFCRVSRQTSLCVEMFGFGYFHPSKLLGGCSEYHVFPPDTSFIRVPDEVPAPLAAASACALRTVVHAFEVLDRIDNHETVVVQGAGPIGLFSAAVARDRGAKKVLMIGAPAARLAVAKDFGVEDTVDIEKVTDPAARQAWVREHTHGLGADIVINAAHAGALTESYALARRGARIASIGVGHAATITLPAAVLVNQIRLSSTIAAEARHWLQALEFLASRRKVFPFEKMLSNTFSLEKTGDALRGMAELREIKPLIYPNATN
jgi:threonine dehydrogenase-like Zn-dependent dehydrogenase